MLSSKKSAEIINNQQPMNKTVIERVKEKLAEKGVALDQSEEIDKNLIRRGKEAVVYEPGDVILMHTKVSASGFFEELIHYSQLKNKKFDTSSPVDVLRMEIEAQNKLINNSKAYKIPDEEIKLLAKNLSWYTKKLEELEKGGN